MVGVSWPGTRPAPQTSKLASDRPASASVCQRLNRNMTAQRKAALRVCLRKGLGLGDRGEWAVNREGGQRGRGRARSEAGRLLPR